MGHWDFNSIRLLKIIAKFKEHEIGSAEKMDAIKKQVEDGAQLSERDKQYIAEKHEQLVAIDEDERKIQKGLGAVRKLLKAEIGDTKRLKEIQEIFEDGNLLPTEDDEYVQKKLDQLEKIQETSGKPKEIDKDELKRQEQYEYDRIVRKSKPPRPTGVTILGILYVIGGLIFLVLAATVGAVASSLMGSMFSQMAGMGGIIAGLIGLLAIFEFIIAGGLFSGKNWGRIIVIIFSIIDLLLQAFTLLGGNIFGIMFIILDIIVLYYMWRPHVIAYFGGSRY